jgi:hypothetical protein
MFTEASLDSKTTKVNTFCTYCVLLYLVRGGYGEFEPGEGRSACPLYPSFRALVEGCTQEFVNSSREKAEGDQGSTQFRSSRGRLGDVG